MRDLTNEELADEELMKKQDYNEDNSDMESSPCCGAEITDQWFCSDCKEHVL